MNPTRTTNPSPPAPAPNTATLAQPTSATGRLRRGLHSIFLALLTGLLFVAAVTACSPAGPVLPSEVGAPFQTQLAKLTAGDAEAHAFFGSSVAIQGDYALVGAAYDDAAGTNAGAVYVYRRDGEGWSELAKLVADEVTAGDRFGASVALDGDHAVVGAYMADGGGAAYVYRRDGDSWNEVTRLTAGDASAGDWFGESVAIDGDRVIVGARLGDAAFVDDTGAAYVFQRAGGSWKEDAKLTASDATHDAFFGTSVAIDRDLAVVGAVRDDGAASVAGAAYLYRRSSGGWTEIAKLTAGDATDLAAFGISVAIDGDHVLVGAEGATVAGVASGAAYLFRRTAGSWSQIAKLSAANPEAGDRFGSAVAIDGDTAVIGAYRDDDLGEDAGAAHAYGRDGNAWYEIATLSANDVGADDGFGFPVAIDGERVLVGAASDDDGGDDAGAAYLFRR